MSLLDIMLADSPGALWTLDDAALSNGKLLDASGNGRHLSPVGSPVLSARNPPSSYAGAAKAIGMGHGVGSDSDVLLWTPASAITPPFTMEAWFLALNGGSIPAGAGVWGSRNPDYGCSVDCNTPDGIYGPEGTRVAIGNTATNSWYTTSAGGPHAAPLNTWHHTVFVLDTTSWQNYFDNSLTNSATGIDYHDAHLADTARALALGYYQSGSVANNYRLNGYMWYAAWYPSALSAARVAARYNEVVPPPSVSNGNASSRTVGPMARFLMGPEPVPAAAAAAAAPSVGQIWPRGAKNTAG